MKKKIITFLILSILFCFTTEAQKGKVTIGIVAGTNFNQFTGKDYDGDKINEAKLQRGSHAGFNVEIPVVSNFALQAGLQFIIKGSKRNDESAILGKYTVTHSAYYIEMPLKIVFKPQAGKGNFLFGVGTDIGYGIGGKWKGDFANGSQLDQSGKIKYKNTIPPNQNPDEQFIRPIDVSISVLIGYQFSNNIFFQFDGQLGLTKINPDASPADPDDKTNIKNVGLGLTLGYRFGKK